MTIPPLRERPEDLPDLCHALLARIAEESGAPVPAIQASDLEKLGCLRLPGNVRELENLLHRAVALGNGESLQFDAFSTPVSDGLSAFPAQTSPMDHAVIPSDLQQHLDDLERQILRRALQATGFNRTAAAAQLGLSLRQMRYRIARLHIDSAQQDDTDVAPV